MKHYKIIFACIILVQSFVHITCTSVPFADEPDITSFRNQVGNTSLLDSLMKGKLTPGMPYYIAEEIFKEWPENLKKTKIPVASLGSKQELEETEGWGRIYSDPDIRIFMDEYETKKGKLKIWYQFPDFYRLDVSGGDSLFVFLDDTVFSSPVSALRKARVLSIKDSFPQIPRSKNLYSEIHYTDHPWRKISYWYTLNILSDGKTFMLKDLNYKIYPIELLELNDEPVTSFSWR
ncbi:MAG TPA: hypothetical protein VMT35_16780 [Ignavibacteriaceae bacterium]|nr:hypothetical protein [Ignavibacteriaceae bacterium]